MCRLCDRAWLGLRNERWGNKHIDDIPMRFWIMEYNQYFPKFYLQRVNRSVIYNPKTCSKRLNW